MAASGNVVIATSQPNLWNWDRHRYGNVVRYRDGYWDVLRYRDWNRLSDRNRVPHWNWNVLWYRIRLRVWDSLYDDFWFAGWNSTRLWNYSWTT